MSEPPMITLSDPGRPGEPVDVVGGGSEREPWRPSGRQRRIALVVVVVLVVGGSAAAALRHRAQEQLLDSRSVTSVALAVSSQLEGEADQGSGVTVVPLRNDGPAAVRVLSARLRLVGYRVEAVDEELPRAGILEVVLAETATCSPSLADEPARPPVLELRLRTHRGLETTVEVPLPPTSAQRVQFLAQIRCGFVPPSGAFQPVFDEPRRVGETVVVRGTFRNVSRLLLTVVKVLAPEGVSVEIDRALPLALPPMPGRGVDAPRVPVTLTVRVTDCASALDAVQGLGDLDDLPLSAVLRGRTSVTTTVPVPLPPTPVRADIAELTLTSLISRCP